MQLQQSDISSLIFYLRGEKIMLDFHLALLYGVETRVLKQAVRRNLSRFPGDFMFQVTRYEWDSLRSQIVILENHGKGEHSKYLPFAFTEQGVAMLSSILKSKQAISVNIAIMRAFVQMRRILDEHKDLKKQLEDLEAKYDKQFAVVFEAIKQLIHEDSKPRNPIGFRINRNEND